MADDALKQSLIETTFIAGELPSPAKLTGSVEQLRLAIQEIDRALGDLYSQQGHIPALSQVLPSGPSLTRLVGAAARINPRQIGRIRITDREVVFAANVTESGSAPSVEGFTHYNRRMFRLPYPPIQITSSEGAASFTYTTSMAAGNFTVGTPGGGYTDATSAPTLRVDPTKRRSTLQEVNATGEWFVSNDGIIHTFDALSAGEAFKVTYTFDALPTNYDGASFNVIPDFSQTGTLCTVTLVSGTTYTVSLPTASHMRGETLSSRTPPEVNSWWTSSTARTSPMSGTQLQLPHLMSTMTVGQTIPAGYLLLWDDTAQEVVEGTTFKYASQTSVTVEGTILTAGSTRYRIVVAGTELTGTVDSLSNSFWSHNHSGSLQSGTGVYMGSRINHYDCAHLIDEGSSNMTGFTVSSAGLTRNPHPMYFHRYGYLYGEALTDGGGSTGNRDNAFLGTLVLSNTNQVVDDAATASYSVYFGGRSTSFPRVRYTGTGGTNRLEITNKDVSIGENFNVTKNATVTIDLGVTGKITGGGDLDITGDASVGADLGVTGDLDVTGTVSAGVSGDGICWTEFAFSFPAAGNTTTQNVPKPSDFLQIVSVHAAAVISGGGVTWYTSNTSSDEDATKYIYIASTAINATLDVTVNFGDDLRSKSARIFIIYI